MPLRAAREPSRRLSTRSHTLGSWNRRSAASRGRRSRRRTARPSRMPAQASLLSLSPSSRSRNPDPAAHTPCRSRGAAYASVRDPFRNKAKAVSSGLGTCSGMWMASVASPRRGEPAGSIWTRVTNSPGRPRAPLMGTRVTWVSSRRAESGKPRMNRIPPYASAYRVPPLTGTGTDTSLNRSSTASTDMDVVAGSLSGSVEPFACCVDVHETVSREARATTTGFVCVRTQNTTNTSRNFVWNGGPVLRRIHADRPPFRTNAPSTPPSWPERLLCIHLAKASDFFHVVSPRGA